MVEKAYQSRQRLPDNTYEDLEEKKKKERKSSSEYKGITLERALATLVIVDKREG